MIRHTLRDLLVAEGHEYVEAADGQVAQDEVRRDPNFGLLVTDFRMPRCDGAQLLEWCRANGLRCPVIFITAQADLFQRDQLALSDCCAAILSKPVALDDLLKAIETARLRDHRKDC